MFMAHDPKAVDEDELVISNEMNIIQTTFFSCMVINGIFRLGYLKVNSNCNCHFYTFLLRRLL